MQRKTDFFGGILIFFLSVSNLLHLFWTVILSIEQFKSGWGYGTRFEMLTLLPIFLEILLAPLFVLFLFYLIWRLFKPISKPILAANITLAVFLLLQYGLFWLFVLM